MRRAVLSGLVAIAAASPAGAQAAPPWSPPVTVFEGREGSSGAIAYSGDGRALVAQSHGYADGEGDPPGVDLATRTPAGRYRTFRKVAGEDPQVIAYGQTRAVVLRYLVENRAGSDRTGRVGVSYGRTSGDIDPVRVIDRVAVDNGVEPLMAASEDGRIAIVYYDGSERLRLAVREPGGDFAHRAVGRAQSGDIALDVGANGDVVVAWRDQGRLKARVQRRGHGLGRVEDLGPAQTTTAVDASVADNGQVAVAWSTVNFASDRQGGGATLTPTVVRAAIRPPGPHLFEPAQTLYNSGRPIEPPLTSVATDSSAHSAVVGWTANEVDAQGTKRYPVLTATSDTARRFGATSQVATEGVVEDVVARFDGMTTVLWTPLRTKPGLFAAARPADGAAFGPAETVTGEQASSAKLTINPRDGLPTAIWNGIDGSGTPALRASTRG